MLRAVECKSDALFVVLVQVQRKERRKQELQLPDGFEDEDPGVGVPMTDA
jgi:hypothetical protein